VTSPSSPGPRPDRQALATGRLSKTCPACGQGISGEGYCGGRLADGIFCSAACFAAYRHKNSPDRAAATGGRAAHPDSATNAEGMTSFSARAQMTSGLFADASNFQLRFIRNYERISEIVGALRVLGMKVVLTSGSFDILHEGHSMYLEAARRFGDFLIVGIDSDEKIRLRKGPHRPAVPEMERLRMVTHQRGVGLVTLKGLQHERWALIKAVQPDVLVTTADAYTPAEIEQLESAYCGRVAVLDRMATVSTSARLRRIQLGLPEPPEAQTGEANSTNGASGQAQSP
jgi:rfaE bifunctional protein nucleotidyltransferase chain/domain